MLPVTPPLWNLSAMWSEAAVPPALMSYTAVRGWSVAVVVGVGVLVGVAVGVLAAVATGVLVAVGVGMAVGVGLVDLVVHFPAIRPPHLGQRLVRCAVAGDVRLGKRLRCLVVPVAGPLVDGIAPSSPAPPAAR